VKNRVRVKLKGYDHRVVDQSAEQIVGVAVRTGAKVAGPVPLPTDIDKHTVVRGPHIDKRSMETFETRTHKRLIDVMEPTGKTIDELSHLNLPAGVGIEIKM
jgi:small subunit ribosomal protein S10